MNIFLIDPKIEVASKYYPDIAPHYIKPYLEKHLSGAQVDFFDLSHSSQEVFLQKVAKDCPQIAVINCLSPTRFESFDLAKTMKEVSPKTFIVLMGPHPTFMYEQILTNYSFVDAVIRGEAEETCLELTGYFDGTTKLSQIKGLCFRENGAVIANERRAFIKDLDQLPFPDHVIYTASIKGQKKRAAVVKTSRGCDGGCKFCTAPSYAGNARFRSTQNIMRELTQLVEKQGVEFIHFYDDTFTEEPGRVYEICEAIKQKGWNIWWQGFARANTIDRPLLTVMKEAGCVKIAIGVESGSQAILDRLGKKTDMERVYAIADVIRELDILLHTCLIVGNPGETNQTIEETKRLIRVMRPDSFSISRYIYLFPGTALSKEYQRKGSYDESLWLDRGMDRLILPDHKKYDVIRWHWDVLMTCWLQLSTHRKFEYIQDIFKWFGSRKVINFLKEQIASHMAPKKKSESKEIFQQPLVSSENR